MNITSIFNSIKLTSFKNILIISIILILIVVGLFNYHSTTYFSCKVKFERRDWKYSDWYRVTVSVNKYLGDRYTLNQYKLSDCEYSVEEGLFRRDVVYCHNKTKNEKETEYLSFDIVNGDIEMLETRGYGNYASSPEISSHNPECRKISRAVD